MTLHILEINDIAIRLAVNDKIVVASAGYALADHNDLLLGNSALKQAHIQPRQVHHRFWQDLNQTPLAKPCHRARTHADLAYLHLEHILHKAGTPSELMVAIPSNYAADQRALLLGVFEATKTKIIGFVDSTVASAAGAKLPAGHYSYVELNLHQLSITQLDVAEMISTGTTQVFDTLGALSLQKICVTAIADAFLTQTRFDPLHHAISEQALYNQLPAWLAQLEQADELPFELAFGQRSFRARVRREALITALQPSYEMLKQAIGPKTQCLLSYRLCHYPGIANVFAHHHFIDELAIFQACAKIELATLRANSGAKYVTRLPVDKSVIAPAPSIAQTSLSTSTNTGAATHLLYGHRAYPLNRQRLYMSADKVAHNTYPTAAFSATREQGQTHIYVENGANIFLNGQTVQHSAALKPGDCVTIENHPNKFLSITVTMGDAP